MKKQLKNSNLQLAIQKKISEQNSEDEVALLLLDEIKFEKLEELFVNIELGE